MKSLGFGARAALLPCLGLLLLGVAWAAQEHVVAQKSKSFSVKKLTVKVGDSVKFVNEDSFAHNVFSLSAARKRARTSCHASPSTHGHGPSCSTSAAIVTGSFTMRRSVSAVQSPLVMWRVVT